MVKAQKDSDLMKSVFLTALKETERYLKQGVDADDMTHAKLVSTTVSNYVRIRAVENSEAAIRLNVASLMSDNIEETRKVVRKSLPEYTNAESKSKD